VPVYLADYTGALKVYYWRYLAASSPGTVGKYSLLLGKHFNRVSRPTKGTVILADSGEQVRIRVSRD
jgi:hypothetical protein